MLFSEWTTMLDLIEPLLKTQAALRAAGRVGAYEEQKPEKRLSGVPDLERRSIAVTWRRSSRPCDRRASRPRRTERTDHILTRVQGELAVLLRLAD